MNLATAFEVRRFKDCASGHRMVLSIACTMYLTPPTPVGCGYNLNQNDGVVVLSITQYKVGLIFMDFWHSMHDRTKYVTSSNMFGQ